MRLSRPLLLGTACLLGAALLAAGALTGCGSPATPTASTGAAPPASSSAGGAPPGGETAPPADRAIPPRGPIDPETRTQYAGSAACLPCHKQLRHQLASRHARTARPVVVAEHREAFSQETTETDPLTGARIRPVVSDGRCWIEAQSNRGTARASAEFALGSGAVGVTYVGKLEDRYVELRLSHYSQTGNWTFTPGQQALSEEAQEAGQSVYALRQAGVPASDPAIRRGVEFLRRTQDDDGTWYVHKRAAPLNFYTDVGFPHGESQYASFNGTCWAVMALIVAQ